MVLRRITRFDPIYELTQVVQGATTTESLQLRQHVYRLSLLGMRPYNYGPSNLLPSTPNGSYTYDADGNTLTDAGIARLVANGNEGITHGLN